MKFNLEWLTLGHIHLEDEELVDNVETLGHTDAFRALPSILVEVSLHLRWVGWQLDSLALQREDVALYFSIVFLGYFWRALGD